MMYEILVICRYKNSFDKIYVELVILPVALMNKMYNLTSLPFPPKRSPGTMIVVSPLCPELPLLTRGKVIS